MLVGILHNYIGQVGGKRTSMKKKRGKEVWKWREGGKVYIVILRPQFCQLVRELAAFSFGNSVALACGWWLCGPSVSRHKSTERLRRKLRSTRQFLSVLHQPRPKLSYDLFCDLHSFPPQPPVNQLPISRGRILQNGQG